MGVRILLGVLIKICTLKNWENMSNYNFERKKIKQVGNIIESTSNGLKL